MPSKFDEALDHLAEAHREDVMTAVNAATAPLKAELVALQTELTTQGLPMINKKKDEIRGQVEDLPPTALASVSSSLSSLPTQHVSSSPLRRNPSQVEDTKQEGPSFLKTMTSAAVAMHQSAVGAVQHVVGGGAVHSASTVRPLPLYICPPVANLPDIEGVAACLRGKSVAPKEIVILLHRMQMRLGIHKPDFKITVSWLYDYLRTLTTHFLPKEHLLVILNSFEGARPAKQLEKHSLGMYLNPLHDVNDIYRKDTEISFAAFVHGVLIDAPIVAAKPEESEAVAETFQWMRYVLIGQDVDMLIAELASVKLDELAYAQTRDGMIVMEPVIGFIILLNGVFIGLQTNQAWEGWAGWDACEITFTLVFVLEAALRIRHLGCVGYLAGSEFAWNIFDLIIILLAIIDLVLSVMKNPQKISQLTILRLVRLTRLARLIRMFRLRSMKELSLMVRGLFTGMLTLFWAILLLLFFVYVAGVAMVQLVHFSRLDEMSMQFQEQVYPLFRSLDLSILTMFRCFIGDCTTAAGTPLIVLLNDAYGPLLVIIWNMALVVVIFGLFNLISAIYIEQTLASAKHQNESNKAQRKEGIRVAQTVRKLLLRFCAAQQKVNDGVALSAHNLEVLLADSSERALEDATILISKETFLLVVQDPVVQRLMDSLDIAAERARLFDVLDADGSGTLGVREIIQGLLRVRGEAQRSDVLAGVLGVRALLDMVRSFEELMKESQKLFDARFELMTGEIRRSSAYGSMSANEGHIAPVRKNADHRIGPHSTL